jgi:hypothetical protein
MFFSGTMEKFEGVRKELLSEVKDADVHKALEQRLELAEINFQEGLIKHITREGEVYGDQVYESGVGLAQEDMGANYMDDSQLLQARNDIERNTQIYAQRKGIPLNSPVYKKMLQDNLTQGHVNVIEALVEDENPEAAKDYFKEFSKEINGDLHDNIDKLIKSTGTALRTQQAVDGYIDQNLTREQAKAQARKDFTGTDRDAAVNRVEARYNEIKNAETRLMKETFDSELADYEDLVAGGATPTEAYEALSETALFDMGGANQHRLRRIRDADIASIAGTTVKTDMALYFELDEFIRQNPDAAQDLNLAGFRDRISPTDLKALNTLRNKDPKDLMSEKQIIDAGLIRMGIDPAEITDEKSGDGEKARAYRTWVMGELGADWDKKDLRETVNRGLIKVMVDDDWFFDDYEYAYLAGQEFNVPGVRPSDVDELAATLESLGLVTSLENIQYADAIRQAGQPITVFNIEALKGNDLSPALPTYEKQSQDFPGG